MSTCKYPDPAFPPFANTSGRWGVDRLPAVAEGPRLRGWYRLGPEVVLLYQDQVSGRSVQVAANRVPSGAIDCVDD